MALRINDPLRNKLITSGIIGGLGTAAILKIYGGNQPLAGGGATTAGMIVQINSIAWATPTSGTASLSTSYLGTANGTDGTASWARLSDTSGTGYVIDGACGTSLLSEFIIDAEVISGTSVVTLTSADIVQPGS
jgi:hypothetical protein